MPGPANGSPPSSYAAYSVVRGEPESLRRFAGLTALRSAIIWPGLAVAGVPKGKRLKAAVYASIGISLFTLALAIIDEK